MAAGPRLSPWDRCAAYHYALRQSPGTEAGVMEDGKIVCSRTASVHKAMLAIPGVDCEVALRRQHIPASHPVRLSAPVPMTLVRDITNQIAMDASCDASMSEPINAVRRFGQNSCRQAQRSSLPARARATSCQAKR